MAVIQEYDALVYDLDGTLVHLDVDWEEVRHAVAAVLRPRGVDVDGADLWSMLELSEEAGYRRLVDETIAEFEREGARRSRRLPTARTVPADQPVGVCSLNAESACRIALETYGLDGTVDVIVGRDSVTTEKPHPEPLLTTVEGLGAAPERTLFVGDSERDEETARRAGTDYVYVRELER
ncbi:phosphoglycolate phosphatase [Halorientalis persicus]|jgi:phosphoglycolate phosphatase-like HAD superfamily hydrolase|uniref:Phosphoglycolate phosphatase n=1 Tax=Halorientalis persicus TaxID=1367881 RepID=A0A1H8JTA4_9EURY|nr:HAD family hydrolase [Halorientalis persicus]SEN83939.1 phosphoglycolate phosphatase [Halorientalis persicus]